MVEQQRVMQEAIVGKRIVAMAWLPNISVKPPFEPIEGTFELQSITLEGGVKLNLWASDWEEVMAEI